MCKKSRKKKKRKSGAMRNKSGVKLGGWEQEIRAALERKCRDEKSGIDGVNMTAFACGMTATALYGVMAGDRYPSGRELRRLCKYLDLELTFEITPRRAAARKTA